MDKEKLLKLSCFYRKSILKFLNKLIALNDEMKELTSDDEKFKLFYKDSIKFVENLLSGDTRITLKELLDHDSEFFESYPGGTVSIASGKSPYVKNFSYCTLEKEFNERGLQLKTAKDYGYEITKEDFRNFNKEIIDKMREIYEKKMTKEIEDINIYDSSTYGNRSDSAAKKMTL